MLFSCSSFIAVCNGIYRELNEILPQLLKHQRSPKQVREGSDLSTKRQKFLTNCAPAGHFAASNIEATVFSCLTSKFCLSLPRSPHKQMATKLVQLSIAPEYRGGFIESKSKTRTNNKMSKNLYTIIVQIPLILG